MTAEPRVGPSPITAIFPKIMASALFRDCSQTKRMTICQWVARIASGLLRLIMKGKHRQPSLDKIPSNTGSSSMINESPSATQPLSCLLISHSKAIREATSALKSLIAIEAHMEDYHLRILDTEEIVDASVVSSLVVGDHTYYERALIGAVSGHGRLRDACWRVAQEGGLVDSARIRADFDRSREDREATESQLKDEMAAVKARLDKREKTIDIIEEENRQLRQAKEDLMKANLDLRRQRTTQTYTNTGNDTCEDQGSSEMTPRRSHGAESCDFGLLSGDNEASEERTVTYCGYTPPVVSSDSQVGGIPKFPPHLATGTEAKVDRGVRSVVG